MKGLVALTDGGWFDFLSQQQPDEVNFWQPSGETNFRALEPGEPLLFKLHSPKNFIVGGGFFAHFSRFPLSLAWAAFGEKNGAATFEQMRSQISRHRHETADSGEDYDIGCIILIEPFFFDRSDWIPCPPDFAPNVVRYKGYDLAVEPGHSLWAQVVAQWPHTAQFVAEEDLRPMFGDPTLVQHRLGQGGFRLKVTDTYRRHCAVTGEKTLPVLEAAHIRPVTAGGDHRPSNGLLLRSDIHTLFDRGYVTITPDYRFRVSDRLRLKWSNGRVYYELAGREISVPQRQEERPDRRELEWHADTVFLG